MTPARIIRAHPKTHPLLLPGIMAVFLSAAYFPLRGQNPPAKQPATPSGQEKPADKLNQPAQEPGGRRLIGFADTPWMSTYSQVKERFTALSESKAAVDRIEILMAVRNEYILIRRNDVLYRYNFYRTPLEVVRLAGHDLDREKWDETEGTLYQVKTILPFIDAAAISKKLEAAYGPRTRSTVRPEGQKGVDIWELEGGFIFQWIEPYNNRPFTRTIDYISNEMARRILKEKADYFTAEEQAILNKTVVR